MDEFAGKRVTVMGLGRFGGGVGVARFLAERGADVLVTDKQSAQELAESVAKLRDLIDSGRVDLRLGEHNVSDFTTCDLVVANPAVQPGNRFLRAAGAAGIGVTTEMRLLVERLPNRLRTIGVTGSAGKSTMTAMIGHILEKALLTPRRQGAKTPSKAGKVWVGGNIGGSLLLHLDEIGEDDWVVLELSSFMLERLRADAHFRGWSPHIAVVTNISPNHLDWHGSMADYVAAKKVIFAYQQPGDVALVGQGVEPPSAEGVKLIACDQPPPAGLPLSIPGEHNQRNAAMAVLACVEAGVCEADDAIDAIADFPGLPHRLQLVAEHNGVRYFNDSKCTTPEAAMLAIKAFTEDAPGSAPENGVRPHYPGIHLILGGFDKGSDMSDVARFAREHCKTIYTIGQTGLAIAAAAREHEPDASPRPDTCGGVAWPAELAEVFECGELDVAMQRITQRLKRGDVVLLSPACASWGQFANFEQRGARFGELVLKYTGETGLMPGKD